MMMRDEVLSNALNRIHPGWLHYAQIVLLALPMLTLYLPGHYGSFFVFPALILVAYRRKELGISKEFIWLYLLFIAYLLLFSLVSMNHRLSFKGSYDMIRGTWFFFIGLLFARLVQNYKEYAVLPIATLPLLFGMFLFPQEHHYGYHVNPNNNAVLTAAYFVFLLPFVDEKKWNWLMLTSLVGLSCALYLLLLENSRGAWLGLAVACILMIWLQRRWPLLLKLMLTLMPIAALLLVYYWFNYKGFGDSLRFEIWSALLRYTFDNSFLLGFGINSAKEIMVQQHLYVLTTHNLVLDLFVSSGVIGMAMFMLWLLLMVRHYWSRDYRRHTFFYVSIFGMTAFLVMAMFDLKFASLNFMATMSLFAGFLYSQRIPPLDKSQ